jgi:hypothetical protein
VDRLIEQGKARREPLNLSPLFTHATAGATASR